MPDLFKAKLLRRWLNIVLTRIIGLRPDNALTIYLDNRIAEKQAALFSIPYGIKTGKRNLSQAVRMSAAKTIIVKGRRERANGLLTNDCSESQSVL